MNAKSVALGLGLLVAVAALIAVTVVVRSSGSGPASGEQPHVESTGGAAEARLESTPAREKIVFEAEEGEVEAPFELFDSPACSGGKCVRVVELSPVPPGRSELHPPFKTSDGRTVDMKAVKTIPPGTKLFPNGTVTVRFTVDQAGEFVFWARCWFSNSCADSFYFSIDTPPPVDEDGDGEYDTNRPLVLSDSTHDIWKWVEKHGRTFKLDAGEHVLRVFNREDGIRIDEFLLARVDEDPEDAYNPVGVETPGE